MNFSVLFKACLYLLLVFSSTTYVLIYYYQQQFQQLHKNVEQNLLNVKKDDVEKHLLKVEKQTREFASSSFLHNAFQEFDLSFKKAANELRKNESFDGVALGLKNVYESHHKDYSEYTLSFSETTRLMQYYYLAAKNMYKNISYDTSYKLFHPVIKNFQDNLNLSALYFVGSYDSVIYSSNKDIIFATNIKRDFVVKNKVTEIMNTKSGVFPCLIDSDRSCYYASETVINEEGRKLGTLIVQLDLNKLIARSFAWKQWSSQDNDSHTINLGNQKITLISTLGIESTYSQLDNFSDEIKILGCCIFGLAWVLLYYLMNRPLRKINFKNLELDKEKNDLKITLEKLQSALEKELAKSEKLTVFFKENNQLSQRLLSSQSKLKDAYALMEITNQRNKNSQTKALELASDLTNTINHIKMDYVKNLNLYENQKLYLSALVNYGEELYKKISVLNDLTFRAKLVAFNTSVEGARAAENATYFNTVATEINEMSNQFNNIFIDLKKNHDEIKNHIKLLQEGNDHTIEFLVNIAKSNIHTAEHSLKNIQNEIQVIAESFNRIAILSFGSHELLKNQTKLLEGIFLVHNDALKEDVHIVKESINPKAA